MGRKRIWTTSPPSGSRIEQSGIGSGLVAASWCSPISGLAEEFSADPLVSSISIGYGKYGPGWRPTAWTYVTSPIPSQSFGEWEYLAFFQFADSLGASASFNLSSYSPSTGFGILVASDAAAVSHAAINLKYFNQQPSSVTVTDADPLIFGETYLVSLVNSSNAGTSTLYVNGQNKGSTAITNGGNISTWYPLGYNGSQGYNSILYLALYFGRVLSFSERLSLAYNPWQIFHRRQRTYSIVQSGGGTVWNVSLTESGSAADISSALTDYLASLSEAGAATDTPTVSAAYVASLTEAGSAGDVENNGSLYPVSIAESGAASDTPSAVALYLASLAESGAASDAQSATASYVVSLTETGAASDTENTGSSSYPVSVAEAGAAADVVSAVAQYAANVAEAASAADIPGATAVFHVSITDSGAASDTPNSGNILTATVSESGAAADTVSAVMVANVSVVEAGTAADVASTVAAYLAQVSESAAATDVLLAAAQFNVTITEVTDGAADALGVSAVYFVQINEAGSAADTPFQFLGLPIEAAATELYIIQQGDTLYVVQQQDYLRILQ